MMDVAGAMATATRVTSLTCCRRHMPMPVLRSRPSRKGPADGVPMASPMIRTSVPIRTRVTVDVLGCDDAARIVLRGVNFKTDSAELTEQSLSILDGVSQTLAAHPEIKVMVAGHGQ